MSEWRDLYYLLIFLVALPEEGLVLLLLIENGLL